MRADADFMVYVAARWPSLVKDAVLLGVHPEQAPDAVTDALSRCRRGWERASQEEDVDQLVRQQLVDAASRRRRTAEPGREEAARELLVLAPPTLEDLKRQESENNRAILKRAGRIAVPLLLVAAGAGAYLATTGDGPAAHPPRKKADVIASAAVSQQENPAPGVTWYADGQLHLDHAVLAVEGLEDMVRLATGVVYGDEAGRVVYVTEDGDRRVLGNKDPAVPVAATDENGWAAWVQTDGNGSQLMVKEANTGNELASLGVDPGSRAVAVDGGTVYYLDGGGPHALVVRPQGGLLQGTVAQLDLLDVRSRTRVFQLDDHTIDVVQGYFSTEFQLPGIGAHLSPDGNLVATKLPESDGTIALYDTRTGKSFADGLTEDDDVLAYAPLDQRTIAYVVAPLGLSPGRELQLRTCDITTTLCKIAARIPNTGGNPVLAR
jgi:hypothetical protein